MKILFIALSLLISIQAFSAREMGLELVVGCKFYQNGLADEDLFPIPTNTAYIAETQTGVIFSVIPTYEVAMPMIGDRPSNVELAIKNSSGETIAAGKVAFGSRVRLEAPSLKAVIDCR